MKLIELLWTGALYTAYAAGLALASVVVLIICVFAWVGFRTGHNDRPYRNTP